MLADDELAAQRNHEEDAEPSAKQRERENAPEGELRAEAQKDQRGNREHDACSKRFAGGAGGLHDIVFENRRAAEGAQDADREDRDGDGRRDGQASAQADIDADSAEEQSEQRAEDDGANREFLGTLLRGDVGPEFSWRSRGTPWTIGH